MFLKQVYAKYLMRGVTNTVKRVVRFSQRCNRGYLVVWDVTRHLWANDLETWSLKVLLRNVETPLTQRRTVTSQKNATFDYTSVKTSELGLSNFEKR